MNALVLYDSKYGNTERIAEAIALTLQEHVPTRLAAVAELHEPEAALGEVDLLVVGGPTQRHGVSPDLRLVVEGLRAQSLERMRVATFDTRLRGMRAVTGSAAVGLARLCRRRGAWVVVPPASFVVDGGEGPLHEGEQEHARAWAREVLQAIGLRTHEPAREPVAG